MSKISAYKTHWCNDLRESDSGKTVTLAGWVAAVRDLGGLIFIELRDRSGLFQIVSDPKINPEIHKFFETLKNEYVVQVEGVISNRPQETYNENLATGHIEMYPTKVVVLNKAKTLPFMLDEEEVGEDLRLKYRYLDIRQQKVLQNLTLRHKVTASIRSFLNNEGFMEVETPVLINPTPEGARDYLVPSRVHQNKFYALPQSPQIFKQLLMVGGIERYYQVARCFRDEDLRSDRQPEFTQVDLEMSFVDQEDVMRITEGMIREAFRVKDIEIDYEIPRMTYKEAMDRYGIDRPDTRFGLELFDVSDIMEKSSFEAFSSIVKSGGTVRAIRIPGISGYSRKDMDDIRNMAMSWGAKGLASITYAEDGSLKSPLLKFFNEEELQALQDRAGAEKGDCVFFMADKPKLVFDILGRLRLYFGDKLGLIDKSKHNLLWVTDFPMFEWDEEERRYSSVHHPFTSPNMEDLDIMETNPSECRSLGYDIIYNGNEVGGGSIRIHSPQIQQKIFKLLGLTEEETEKKFGFMIKAFDYGTPPHGGIALGLDRLVALLSGAESIRDVIAFPKNSQARCLMTDSPTETSEAQLRELHIKLRKPELKK